MPSFRTTLLALIAIFAFLMGVLFVLPAEQKSFVHLEINGASLVAEVADTPEARVRGLSGRTGLTDFGGMLFTFDHPDQYGIWMKDMHFPLDILWIKSGRVADLEENVQPPASGIADQLLPVYKPDVAADMVLELNAGFAQKHSIKIGDSVVVFSNNKVVGRVETALVQARTPQVGSPYFIETLRGKTGAGRGFRIDKLLTQNSAYQKFSIFYRSGDLVITGVMNVPKGAAPKEGFPVLILNHGLIKKEIYFSGRGSKREQDFFARQGYVTIHPDYRGYASSSQELTKHFDFFEGYAEDVVNLIDAVKIARLTGVDTTRIGVWGHSMGGGVAARLMVARPDIRAFVLFAPNSAIAEENFYELSPDEIVWLEETYGKPGSGVYKKISPLSYFADVAAPVQLHHGTADSAVPIAFSQTMYQELKRLGKKVEFYTYPGQEHEFIEDWPLAAERSLQFFDKYVKNAR